MISIQEQLLRKVWGHDEIVSPTYRVSIRKLNLYMLNYGTLQPSFSVYKLIVEVENLYRASI